MVINPTYTIALKNSFGNYETRHFTMFDIQDLSKYFKSYILNAYKNKQDKDVHIHIKCPICGNEHHYNYKYSEFLKLKMIIGGCETMGIPVFYIGNNDIIKEKVDSTNMEKKLSLLYCSVD